MQIVCPACGDIFPGLHGQHATTCRHADHNLIPSADLLKEPRRPVTIAPGDSQSCMLSPRTGTRPAFRLYGKLVLTQRGTKEYLPAGEEDHAAYQRCSARLQEETDRWVFSCLPLHLKTATTHDKPWAMGSPPGETFSTIGSSSLLDFLHAAIGQVARCTVAGCSANVVLRRARIQQFVRIV